MFCKKLYMMWQSDLELCIFPSYKRGWANCVGVADCFCKIVGVFKVPYLVLTPVRCSIKQERCMVPVTDLCFKASKNGLRLRPKNG